MKRILTVLLVVVSVLMLSSCASSLAVNYNQPSNINMSRYQNIAIASTQSYNGTYTAPVYIRNMIFDGTIPRFELYSTSYNFRSINNAVSNYVDKMVMGAFTDSSSKGYYHVLGKDETDTYLSLSRIGRDAFKELRNDGYDAILIPRVTVLSVDEFISADWAKDKDNKKYVKYTLQRLLTVSISLSVVDTTTGQIAVQRTYTNKVVNKQTFEPTKIKFFSDYITSNMVVDCLYSMKSAIVDDFVPTQRSTYISLMANKPKLPVLETAYSAAKGGNLSYALDIFKNTYETSGHIAAGYNAAVILAAQNDIENALVVLSDIRSKAGANSKVNNLYGKLMTLKEKNDLALSQMTSSSGDAPDLSSKQSVLDYLLN